ncbi:hypothetical protein RHMOL_Rhmol07G0047800 [Rhododendron molle]|uniref:Uncharacterized protein n=1 Tax=Rhododendron molle TaxID=49168 RepID=A0ACC0MWW6_RHOML|nr:hypothetical protein RHMOL_Rhmol07G0047800 [Rhododendron molle]
MSSVNTDNVSSHTLVKLCFVVYFGGINKSFILGSSSSSLSFLAPLEAILFDIDGTLCDSDPIHYLAFREMLQEIGFNGGAPITEEFFIQRISGKHNGQLCEVLLPDWDFPRAMKFMHDKEAFFRSCCLYQCQLFPYLKLQQQPPPYRLAAENLQPMNGLNKLCKWIEDCGLKRAAVTNAPKSNAELLLSMLCLEDYFKTLVLAEECDRVKPFPDPYLKALVTLGVSNKHTFVFEDSVSGIKAGVGAGMPVVGLATRNPEELLLEAGAIFVIKDFDDPKLWSALKELENKAEITPGTS